MCDTCGCGQTDNDVTISMPGTHKHTHIHNGHSHEHSHDHDHHHHDEHDHEHHHDHGRIIQVEQDILKKNDLIAERNRGYFQAKKILTFNLVSSPGSGKTTLLEKTIDALQKDLKISVIEGDQQTMQDAERIKKTGAKVVQINTGQGCHLDAEMINKALDMLNPDDQSILMIENVGNLVCPALFDLGERNKIVIISVTEGDDKPLKYPTMFSVSDICIINKTDLLPYVDFDMEKCRDYAFKVNHHLKFFEVSARTGDGMKAWYEWLRNQVKG
ncbi:MAG: hydrogenase nickel incorporation protein HypB [Calditrichaceae bacterium]|nr:hydrogenase nickel incorporation protein HypB [Calditrichaceae bacterium]MBN2709897.1 hydrogenase nickel incorporation protein HypB [Calditrichaceae bacterium]RQV92653.1 MAG: hydrogenase accessory protein HypB [Calditrichota bacterium]